MQVIGTLHSSRSEVINVCVLQTNMLTVYLHQLNRTLSYSSRDIVELITPLPTNNLAFR